jgi:organic hydroperoxide reductase OsmC/OhrA
MARASKVEYSDLLLDAEGVVDRPDGATRFTEIRLRASVTVPPGVDRDRVQRLLEKAERGCLVSASLSTPVRLETAIAEIQTAR